MKSKAVHYMNEYLKKMTILDPVDQLLIADVEVKTPLLVVELKIDQKVVFVLELADHLVVEVYQQSGVCVCVCVCVLCVMVVTYHRTCTYRRT